MALKRWQDWGNGILGLWTVVSPWVLGFSLSTTDAARAAWILGAAIVVLAAIAVYMPRAWEEGLNILLGLGLLTSPWALSYADVPKPTANAVCVGVLVTLLALWAMLRDTQVQKWWHERHATR
jgi:SPW repeat